MVGAWLYLSLSVPVPVPGQAAQVSLFELAALCPATSYSLLTPINTNTTDLKLPSPSTTLLSPACLVASS